MESLSVLGSIALGCGGPAYALAFIPASQPAQRAAIFALSTALTLRLQLIPQSITNNYMWNGLVLVAIWALTIRAADLLFLKKVQITSLPDLYSKTGTRNASSNGDSSSKLERFWAAVMLINSARYVGTRYEVKNVPSFSKKDKDYVPSRGRFLLRSMIGLILAYLFLDLVDILPHPDIDVQCPKAKEAIFSRISEVDVEEFVMRSLGVLAIWIATYCIISAEYHFAALIAVGSGLSEPRSWPPMFGSFADAWSIRQFWGTSWHQQLRSMVEPSSDFISSTLLRIPKGTLVSRYLRLTLAFLVSGLFHVLVEAAQGQDPWESGAPRMWVTQVFGIMIEDTVQEIYRRSGGRPNLWSRLVGYIWLGLFLTWTCPPWQWNIMRVQLPRQLRTVPFSFWETIGLKF